MFLFLNRNFVLIINISLFEMRFGPVSLTRIRQGYLHSIAFSVQGLFNIFQKALSLTGF